MTEDQKLPFYWGVSSLLIGVALCAAGEVGWIFGVVFLAMGIGSVAAGFTDCEPPRPRTRTAELSGLIKQADQATRDRRKAERDGAAERSAISAAVCAGMKDGSFYRDPKGTVSGARSAYAKDNS